MFPISCSSTETTNSLYVVWNSCRAFSSTAKCLPRRLVLHLFLMQNIWTQGMNNNHFVNIVKSHRSNQSNINVAFVHFSNFLQAILFIHINHLSFINFILQFLVPLQSHTLCFVSSSSWHVGYILSAFLPTPFNYHTPSNNHATPLLSF